MDMAEFQNEDHKYENDDKNDTSFLREVACKLNAQQNSTDPVYNEVDVHSTNGPSFHGAPEGRSLISEDFSQDSVCVPDYNVPLSYELPSCSGITAGIVNSVTSTIRPGTPALSKTNVETVYDEAPPSLRLMGCTDAHYYAYPNDPSHQGLNHLIPDKVTSGAESGEVQQPHPTTGQRSLSPSRLYSLLLQLQGHRHSSEAGDQEYHPQRYTSSHLENTYPNLIQVESSNKENQHDMGKREATKIANRQMGTHHHTLGSCGDIERRRPVINHNLNCLSHNMVRLQHTGCPDQNHSERNGANGPQFVEDGEGNHNCNSLQNDTNHHEAHLMGNHSETERPMAPIANDRAEDGTYDREVTSAGNSDISDTFALGASIYQGEWPMNRVLWISGPSSIGETDSLSSLVNQDTASIMSFSSSTATTSARRSHSHQLGTKVEMVYSLLSMLGSNSKEDMSRTLLAMSSNQDSCIAMRQSGCLPLLIQLLHGGDRDSFLADQDPHSVRWALREARRRASQALHNIVHAHPDDKRGRREARVLRLLEQIRDYSDYLRDVDSGITDLSHNENLDLHPGPAIAALMKLSFDEEHRHAMCQLGGLQAIAELIQADHEVHGNTSDQFCITVRRYAGMALTNLTFGDGTNKALLCSMKTFMQALVAQLHSPSEDLRQVTASVLRNLSWRADASSKQILREVGAVVTLMKAAMEATKESTLKSILSALWNLSAHCSMNKADICAVDGALAFLVSTLTYKSSSKTLSIIENGGGILRNISSHIAVREDYRAILRKHKCLQTLLIHLKSPSLTVVSNACGTLWNLSARCPQDQQSLWEMGAVGMLRNLVHSKHKMISMGSSAALKNLLGARPPGMGIGLGSYIENGHHRNGNGKNNMPSLLVRKQRALESEIDQNLSETCDNIDSPKTSPPPITSSGKKFTFDANDINKQDEQRSQYLSYLPGRMYHSINGHITSPIHVPRSDSKDSIGSTHSEPPHYKAQRERFRIFVNSNRFLSLDSRTVQEKPFEWKEKTNLTVEDNSNIVVQLFSSLQNNSATMEASGGVNGSSLQNATALNNVNKQAIRPNSLPSQKRSVWDIAPKLSNKVANRNISSDPQSSFYLQPNRNNGIHENNRNHQHGFLSSNNSADSEKCNIYPNGSPRHRYLSSVREAEERHSINTNGLNEDGPLIQQPGNKRQNEREKFVTHVPEYSEGAHSSHMPAMTEYGKNSDIRFNEQDSLINSENLSDIYKKHSDHRDASDEEDIHIKKTEDMNIQFSASPLLKQVKNEPENSIDQTPLVSSRCSSVSSLTSCIQQSARSSWVSDISQRTSGIISPTELPDSPGSGISEVKHQVFEFTDKAPDAESNGLIRPRPAWPANVSSVTSDDSLNSSGRRLPFESDISVHHGTAFNICDPSRTSTISEQMTNLYQVANGETQQVLMTPPTRPANTPEKDSGPSTESSSPQDDEQESELPEKELLDEALLAACVSLGMPNNSSSNQHNNSKLHSRVNNLSTCLSYLRSGIPVKATNVRLTQSVPNISKPLVLSSCAAAPLDATANQDSLRLARGSASKSACNVSRAEQAHSSNYSSQPHISPVCDDNDNLLFQYTNSEMIQARAERRQIEQQVQDPSDGATLHDGSPTRSKSKLPFLTTRKPELQSSDSMAGIQSNSSISSATVPKCVQISKKHSTSIHSCGLSHGWQNSRPSEQVTDSRHRIQAHNECYRYSNSADSESQDSNTPHSFSMDSSAGKFHMTEDNSQNMGRWIRPIEAGSSDGKSKTSIPQIVRPWPISLDNEVHPRQLQIMSQNLPVYKGSYFTQDAEFTTESIPLNQEDLLQTDTYTMENIPVVCSRNGSQSSLSVDSEEDQSSTEAILNECIAAGKPRERSSRSNRSKIKRNKHIRRSAEIVTLQDHSSEEDNKNNVIQETRIPNQVPHTCMPSVQSSDCEEKGKEDERTREKSGLTPSSRIIIPDLLEGAQFRIEPGTSSHTDERQQRYEAKSDGSPKGMSDSIELRRGAQMIASELDDMADDITHSSVSCFSDLENVKPPSVMGEVSMTSSGLSDLLSNGNGCYMNGKHSIDRRRHMKRSKKTNGNHRFVLKTVRQALGGNLDIPRSSENPDKPPSATGSVENLSMRSSGTSELLDNINPPSIMDEISMTNSCASLNSISSDILESRSQSLADANLRSNSEMFQRLNAAAAMVQVYSRELSNIMTGSMKSSYNSDNLDQVKPPSVFQDIAEVTVEDGTEVASDTMASDSELEEELPHDDEGSLPSSETIQVPHHMLAKEDQAEGSTENLVSSFDTDGAEPVEKPHQAFPRISSLALTPQTPSNVEITNQYAQYTFPGLRKSETLTRKTNIEKAITENKNPCLESDHAEATNVFENTPPVPQPIRKGPRIVKPINRETVRQMQEKKNAEKPVKSIRGRAAPITARNLLQRLTGTRSSGPSKSSAPTSKASPPVSTVRPTRTSALRASQNQKQVNIRCAGGRVSPRSFLSKPPSITGRANPKVVKTSLTLSRETASGTVGNVQSTSVRGHQNTSRDSGISGESKKPLPPVKQNTFTKEKPTQNAPDISAFSPGDPTLVPDPRMTKSQNDSTSLEQSVVPLEKNGKISQTSDTLLSPVGKTSKTNRKLSFCSSPAVNRSSSNYTLRRNLSAPVQRRGSSKAGLRSSPSTQSLGIQDTMGKKVVGKRSPSSASLSSRGISTSESRTVSTISLSSMSSSGMSLKRTGSQKEVTSKIASIWKRSESSSSANSPVGDSPSTDRGVSPVCRTNGGSTSKTISSKSSAVMIKSNTTTSTSSQNRITRSSTYEKLPKGGEANQSAKRPCTLKSSTSSLGEKTIIDRPISTINENKNGLWRKTQQASISKTSSNSENMCVPLRNKGALNVCKNVRQPPQNLQKSKLSKVRNRNVVSPGNNEATLGFQSRQTSSSICALGLDTSTVPEPKGLRSFLPVETKTSPASAVVPPFNYIPSTAKKQSIPDQTKMVSGGNLRRDSYVNSIQSGDDIVEDKEDDSSEQADAQLDRKKCLVTMV